MLSKPSKLNEIRLVLTLIEISPHGSAAPRCSLYPLHLEVSDPNMEWVYQGHIATNLCVLLCLSFHRLKRLDYAHYPYRSSISTPSRVFVDLGRLSAESLTRVPSNFTTLYLPEYASSFRTQLIFLMLQVLNARSSYQKAS